MAFLEKNPHPQGLRVGDCVKRAIVLASGINYHDIGIMLNRYKKETQTKRFNNIDNAKLFIVNILKGYDLGNMQHANHGNRYTVEDFADLAPMLTNGKKAICQVSHHMVAIDGKGNYCDTWNSGEKSIYKVWTLPPYEKIIEHIKNNYPKLCKGLTLEKYRIYIPIY